MLFDAVSIESAFTRLTGDAIGARGTSHDADVFRFGKVSEIGVALHDAANALEERIRTFTFTQQEVENGGAKARLKVAISCLRETATTMKSSSETESNNYHWLITGNLVSTTEALLEMLKSRGA